MRSNDSIGRISDNNRHREEIARLRAGLADALVCELTGAIASGEAALRDAHAAVAVSRARIKELEKQLAPLLSQSWGRR